MFVCGKFGIVIKKGAYMEDFAFKLVCIDDSSPMEFMILDDVNKGNLNEIHSYLEDKINEYDLSTCKWLILPIKKQEK